MTKISSAFYVHLLVAVLCFQNTVANTGVWSDLTSMITPRSDHSAITIGDMIVVTGGCVKSQVCPPEYDFCFCPEITNITEAFYPLSNSWTTLSSMPTPRFRHAVVNIGPLMYLIGGRDLNDNIITAVDVYNADSNRWTTVGNWANATSDLSAAAIGSVIYAIGGYDANYASLKTVWTFNTSASAPTWKFDAAAPLHVGRGDSCIVSMDGKLYIYGGFNDANFCSPLASLEVFDPQVNQWTVKANLDIARGDSACGVANSRVHAVGGETKDKDNGCSKFNIPIRHVERYNIDSNTWEDETNLPTERMRFAAAAYNNTFYIFGGQARVDSSNSYPLLGTVESWSHIPSSATYLSAGFLVILLVVLF